MKDEQLREYFEIYTDAWKLFHKYSNPDGSRKFWDDLLKEQEEIWEKHGRSEFTEKILLDTIDEIEYIWKRGKRKWSAQ